MNTKDTNRVNMIRATANFCDDNTAATAAIPAFSAVLARVKNNLTLMDSLDQVAVATTGGVTLDTIALRIAMSEIGIRCASATFAYASSVNNNTLKAQVDYTLPKLDKFKKEEVDDVCQTIHDAANANIVAVTPFGITAADVTNLQTSIDLYRTGMQNPRQAIITRSDAISQISALIRTTIDDLLKSQMDKMVNTLKSSNQTFYSQYYLSREIIDLGSTTAKLRGTISDNGGNALTGAVVSIHITGQPAEAYKDITDTNGEFNISGILPNDYDIFITATGFQPQKELNIHISAGQEVNREYIMLPV